MSGVKNLVMCETKGLGALTNEALARKGKK